MDRWVRWVIALVAVAGVVGMLAFARGTPDHAEPTAPPAALVTVIG